MILLGTGTSVGVPSIGCGCDVCRSDNPRNKRTRCSISLGLPEGNLLVDTSPDLRFQLLREGIGIVHAVAYTHEHADHIFGLDDPNNPVRPRSKPFSKPPKNSPRNSQIRSNISMMPNAINYV